MLPHLATPENKPPDLTRHTLRLVLQRNGVRLSERKSDNDLLRISGEFAKIKGLESVEELVQIEILRNQTGNTNSSNWVNPPGPITRVTMSSGAKLKDWFNAFRAFYRLLDNENLSE